MNPKLLNIATTCLNIGACGYVANKFTGLNAHIGDVDDQLGLIKDYQRDYNCALKQALRDYQHANTHALKHVLAEEREANLMRQDKGNRK
jgi:hypothetical protein